MELLYNDEWTVDAESQLLQRVQDILSLVRSDGMSFRINLELDVNDADRAMFLINSRLQNQKASVINNHKLTIREIEILGLIMLGNTNQQIAQKLFISYETVKSHRKHILEKTGAPNTAALINHYHQTFFEK